MRTNEIICKLFIKKKHKKSSESKSSDPNKYN